MNYHIMLLYNNIKQKEREKQKEILNVRDEADIEKCGGKDTYCTKACQ